MSTTGDTAYTQAVHSGQYQQVTGLRGKYDNVRRFWEDAVTGRFCAPPLTRLLEKRRKAGRRLRLMDLGCGSGDGYETICSIQRSRASLSTVDSTVVSTEDIECYTGVDLNAALLDQARQRYGTDRRISFRQGDLSRGLQLEPGEAPYDVYFSSFGTMSHLHHEELVRLLTDIASQAPDGALFVGDWIGRYSIEWRNIWDRNLDTEQWMDYRISYIYPPEIRNKIDIQILPLRLVAPQEIHRALDEASRKSGVQLSLKSMFDRSLWIGRHIDTGEYNGHAQQIREKVNRLMEPGVRTDLASVRVTYDRRPELSEIDQFAETLSNQWNEIITEAETIIGNADYARNAISSLREKHPKSPGVTRCLERLAAMVVAPTEGEIDVRADFAERLVAMALRELEIEAQEGKGCGHGLVAIVEVCK